jgi:FAD/FMN-containing dehydrogenase
VWAEEAQRPLHRGRHPHWWAPGYARSVAKPERSNAAHGRQPDCRGTANAVPLAAVPEFLREADAAVQALIPGCRPVPFGHLGDGNIHYNVTQPVGAQTKAYLARWYEMNDAVHAVVAKFGGSISAEHGIGVMKRKPLVKDPVALDLMRALKRTLDPNGILNPGKVI